MIVTRADARKELQEMANKATALGYQVTFTSRTETEGSAAGKTLTGINISILTDG